MKAGSGKSCPTCGDRYDADVLFCPKDGTPLASARNPSLTSIPTSDRDPYIGIELPGQIRIDTLIGIGSMGRVYRAFQSGIDRDVAVKVLHRELSGNVELTGRFHREAKVASRLVHPNVVQVLMTGAMPAGDDARSGRELYLVMEFLDGISLLSALAAAGGNGASAALPLPRALHIGLQICDAVGEAHAQGIVHRDLKPENVMLVRRGDNSDYVKVLDFGIARLDWADRGAATQAGLIFGTAKYISPEGAEGHPVSPAADVYSIATMLYQMLAGRTPFDGDSPVALLVQHTHAPPLDLRSVARASYVPAPLAATIMANLAKKPTERAPNARQLARDLVAAARASGLYPEEFASQATLFSPASSPGAVKLASRERTRAHELSAELAAKIGGVAASSSRDPKKASVPVGAGFTVVSSSTDEHEHVDTSELIIDGGRPPIPPAQGCIDGGSPPIPPVQGCIDGEPRSGESRGGGAPTSPGLIDSPGSVRAPRDAPSSIGPVKTPVPAVALTASAPAPVSRSIAPRSSPPPMPSAIATSGEANGPRSVQPLAALPAGASRPGQTPAPPYGAPREAASASIVSPVPPSVTSPVPGVVPLASSTSSSAAKTNGPTILEDPTAGTMPGTPLGHVVGDAVREAGREHGAPPSEAVTNGVNATIHGEDPQAMGLVRELTERDVAFTPPVSAGDPTTEQGIAADVRTSKLGDDAPRASFFPRSLAEARSSAKMKRIAVLAACLFIGLPVLAVGGRRAGIFGASVASDSLEAALEDARECMRHRAWDAPKARNFKLVTDEALVRWPDSAQLADLRREGAVLIVNDALARKYANDPAEAAHLVELALHFDPDLTTAQHLAQELASEKPKDPPPVATTSASSNGRVPKGKAPIAQSPPSPGVPRTPTQTPQTTPAGSTRPSGGTPPASTGPWL